jgi:hypothetical protein
MLVPKEPFVLISAILLSEAVSHKITLPSYVVVLRVFPSGESARAHAWPIISRVSPIMEVKCCKKELVPSVVVGFLDAGLSCHYKEKETTCGIKLCLLFPL